MNIGFWLPFVVLEYVTIAWLTHRYNQTHLHGYSFLLWAVGCIPLWPIIVSHSKDVVRDGLYFDMAFTMVYTLSILYFTKSFYKFGYNQWIGLACAVACIYFFQRGT